MVLLRTLFWGFEPRIKLIEIDKDLIVKLGSKVFKNSYIEIIQNDILKYDFNGNIDLIISNLPLIYHLK